MDILGILSLIFGAFGTLSSYWYIGIVPCAVGFVLGIIGMKESYMDSKSSIMGLLLSVLGAIASVFFVVSDLDSGALELNAKRFGGEMISSEKSDDFMRFHREGWTPEQGAEVAAAEPVEVMPETQTDGAREEITPYWIKDSENTVRKEPLEIRERAEERSEIGVRGEEQNQLNGNQQEEKVTDSEEENYHTEREQDHAGRWVLYSDDNVVISYDGMYRDDFLDGYNIKLIVENLSNKTLMVQCRETSVNGYMVEPICSVEIAPGKKAADNMTIYGDDAKRAPYGSVNNIETKFIISDNDNWMENIRQKTLE